VKKGIVCPLAKREIVSEKLLLAYADDACLPAMLELE
jgi:hypothetical protein